MAKVDAWIDADELHKEASDAAEEEIFAGEQTEGEGLGGALPEPPGEGEGEDQLIDGGGLDGGRGRVGQDEGACVLGEAVGHVDSPWEGSIDAVVAVSGEQAADPTDAVSDGSGGSGKVQHAKGCATAGEAIGLGGDALVHEHCNAGEQATVPCEAGLEPVEEVEEDFG